MNDRDSLLIEEACLQCLTKAWNKFIGLPVLHPDDQREFKHAIHAAQNIVMARGYYKMTADQRRKLYNETPTNFSH